MSLDLYEFTVRRHRTGASIAFIGQGASTDAAFKEGFANLTTSFRPSSNGVKRPEHGVRVILRDGREIGSTLKVFESDILTAAEEGGGS